MSVKPDQIINNKANWKRSANLTANVDRGELYVFKLGIWAKNKTLKNVRIKPATDFLSQGKAGIISKSFFRYADSEKALETATYIPQPFTVEKNVRQIIYCAVSIPAYISPTTFSSKLNIEVDGQTARSIGLKINVLHTIARKQDVSKNE